MSKSYLGTYNGSVFDPLSNTGSINLESIAVALSNNVRFCGHTLFNWSIAQHSLLVTYILSTCFRHEIESEGLNVDKVILLGLLHDASEAFLSDICRPVKSLLPDYKTFENKIQTRIIESFNIKIDEDYAKCMKFVGIADNISLYAEALVLMNPCDEWLHDYADGFSLPHVNSVKQFIEQRNSQIVESEFICKCVELTNKLCLTGTPCDDLPKFEGVAYGNPLYRAGKVEYTYQMIDRNTIEFVNCETARPIILSVSKVNNTIDLFKLIGR